MKRVGNLFEEIVDYDNIKQAHRNARKGKHHYTEVQMVNEDEEKYLRNIEKMLRDDTFTTSDYVIFKIFEPKEREIFKLPYYPDRIIHHAIMNVLQPIWDKTFIYNVYSAIPDRGIHAAIERLDRFLDNEEDTEYCLQFDIKKFYPSVNHDILMKLIKRTVKDKRVLGLLEDIVRSPPSGKGIPIGNYTSQYFANIYLNWFDHYVKQELKRRYYIRYADDGIILGSDKDELHEVRDKLEEYLRENLDLQLNNRTQVYPLDRRGIDFLGYRTFRDYRLLRKRSARKFRKKIGEIKTDYSSMEPIHVLCSIMSYMGWIKYCDGFNLLQEYILGDEEVLIIVEKACNELEVDNPLNRGVDKL